MIDKTALFSLSYGLYLVSSKKDGRSVGCTVNTFAQVTSDPLQVSVAINKDNFTTQGIQESGCFEAVVLAEDAPMELIGGFGFHSSETVDKFEPWSTSVAESGIEYVNEHICAHVSVKVVNSLDLGSHIFFVGEVTAAEAITGTTPMTYAYYHQVKGGKTPPKASSYIKEEELVSEDKDTASKPQYAWRCTVCGHIEYVDELPDDFKCPVCGVGKDKFERIEL